MNPYRPPYPNELYHHGIKGQKWGVRNGPPYPLSSKVHASVVKGKKRGRVGSYPWDEKRTPEGYEYFNVFNESAHNPNKYITRKNGQVYDIPKYREAINASRAINSYQIGKTFGKRGAIRQGALAAGAFGLSRAVKDPTIRRGSTIAAGVLGAGALASGAMYLAAKRAAKPHEEKELAEWQKHDPTMIRYKGYLYRKKRKKR